VKLSREVKTGIVVIVAIGLFIYGYNFLKGKDLFSTSTDLYARYDKVEGMTANSAVWINGFKVGQVRDIKIDPKTNELIVHFTISNDDARIPKNATATIASDGLLGTKVVQIIMPSGVEPALLADADLAQDGDTLQGVVQQGLTDAVRDEIKPLREKVTGLIASIDSVVTIVKTVLDKEGRENLVEGFESIKNALATFEHTAKELDSLVSGEREKISDVLTKVQSITTNLANNNEELSKIFANVEAITDSLAKSNVKQTIARTNAAMGQAADIMEKVNKGEGSMGMLVNSKKLHNSLDSAVVSLERLLSDMKAHPKRYVHFSVFGRRDKTPAPVKN